MYEKGKHKGMTRFGLKASGKKVQLAGDFSNWEPVVMRKQKDGMHVANVTLPAGRYRYKFVVDGQWMADPDHMERELNQFGTADSVVITN